MASTSPSRGRAASQRETPSSGLAAMSAASRSRTSSGYMLATRESNLFWGRRANIRRCRLAGEITSGSGSRRPTSDRVTLKEEEMANQLVWVDIPVDDLDRAIGFYSLLLGAPIRKEE